ncbi:hypothetical protein RFI_07429 [Reticulomyxa filosa]|uniref:Uncharacterized protein n=1 Tax=Reticulomyxa filosa TaxID=46433 RepID=X6NUW7_RETFI|nr:hypothetical protein RFI_07429 [Reticulomyxa filosa]|eukprot:ETO29693.1 hypothetical protein RFI_07429 [Reticulomyxa filosa]
MTSLEEKSKPANWNEIKEWAEKKTTEYFKRSAEVDKAYNETLKERESLINDENDEKIPIELFIPNRFPYLIEADIYHYLLWHRKQFKDISQDTLNQTVSQYVLAEHKKLNNLSSFSLQHLDIIWFENPLHRRSYPGISHLQIFWKDNRNLPLSSSSTVSL